MRVVALSLAESFFSSPEEYLDCLKATLRGEKGSPCLVVLPAGLALLTAYRWGDLGNPKNLAEALRVFVSLPPGWHGKFLELHAGAAADLDVYLVAGTDLQPGKHGLSHTACLFSPRGTLVGSQQQLYLSRQEKQWGWSRGSDAGVFITELGSLGIIVGTDAWYPEVGRILALKGADIVCHCGTMEAAVENSWRQLAGMWQQVQQNQFFAVESQLAATVAGTEFFAWSVIHAPCEMTDAYTGVLAKGGADGKPVVADLDNSLRKQVKENYPLLQLLNPSAYGSF